MNCWKSAQNGADRKQHRLNSDIPGQQERSRGPAGVKAALRAPHLRSKSLDTGLTASANMLLFRECHSEGGRSARGYRLVLRKH